MVYTYMKKHDIVLDSWCMHIDTEYIISLTRSILSEWELWSGTRTKGHFGDSTTQSYKQEVSSPCNWIMYMKLQFWAVSL